MLRPFQKRIVDQALENLEGECKRIQKVLGKTDGVESLDDLEMCIAEVKKEVGEL